MALSIAKLEQMSLCVCAADYLGFIFVIEISSGKMFLLA